MDHIDRQRELLQFIGLVKPGNVLKMHYTNLGFGNEGKPYHFAVNITESGTSLETVLLVPVSTKLFQKRYFVELNLSKDSNLRESELEQLDLESYALIPRLRQVKIPKLFETPSADLRGSLTSKKRDEILETRKSFLSQQFSNKNRGESK